MLEVVVSGAQATEHNSHSFPLLLRELSLKRVSSLRGRVAGATWTAYFMLWHKV